MENQCQFDTIEVFAVLVLLTYMDFCPEVKLDFDRLVLTQQKIACFSAFKSF